MPKQVITFSLDKTLVEKMDVLANGQSRTEWLRVNIREGITRRLAINDAAITQFRQLAGEAVRREQGAFDLGDAEGAVGARKVATDYQRKIDEYEAEKGVLYGGARGGV